ncbi:MAG TPA: PDZ domain-containing protein, partial [Longimicrobiaceae bacterium]|nr:PDZ domain-containing protein [Longimicrobiaceae bacterium]
LIADTVRIVRAEKALFGELPYDRFTFILHLLPGGSGGLEHKDSTVLVADRFAFRGQAYESFLGLVAHELFHAWNGKRIRPAVLGPFDYVRESYTRELWVVEGITTYYTDLILRRAGIITPQRYMEKVAEQVTRLGTIPGRMVQPLEDASFDAWIKFYRPDANSPNATVSYYHKGGLVALLLDLTIRGATGGERSLDDVMRALWEQYGRPDAGFPERRVEEVASEVAGVDLAPSFDRWLRSTQELDFAPALAAFGVMLAPAHEPRPGAPAPPPPTGEPGAQQMREVKVGFQFKFEGGKTIIGNVMAGTPAWRAGVSHGDELVALDGLRVDAMSLGLRMQEKAPGSTAILTVFRRDELINLAMQVESGPPARLIIHPRPDATPAQQALLMHWLREDPPRDAG